MHTKCKIARENKNKTKQINPSKLEEFTQGVSADWQVLCEFISEFTEHENVEGC